MKSLSARRAWIEMQVFLLLPQGKYVALRKESVDRNVFCGFTGSHLRVALRKESVDRNFARAINHCANTVALRKESVDRNTNNSV